MTAGLPAVGLSGLFVVLTALLLPLLSRRRPRGAGRMVALALLSLTVTAGIWATMRLAVSDGALDPMPAIAALGVSVMLLSVVLLIPALLHRVLGSRPTPLPHQSDSEAGRRHQNHA